MRSIALLLSCWRVMAALDISLSKIASKCSFTNVNCAFSNIFSSTSRRSPIWRQQLLTFFLTFVLTLGINLPLQAIDYDFSGFLTFGAGKLDSKEVSYLEFDDSISFASDTKIGGQLELHFNDELSFISKVAVEAYTYTPDEDYRPHFVNAYVRYKPSPSHAWRAGMVNLPSYYYSDYTQIGAAYPWVRLPNTTYDKSFSSLNRAYALDYFHQRSIGDWFMGFQFFLANVLDQTTLDGSFDFDSSAGFNTTAQYGDLALRLSYYQLKVKLNYNSSEYDALLSGLQSVAVIPGLEPLVGLLEELGSSSYSSIGLVWEPSSWSIYSEVYRVDTDNAFVGYTSGGYISLLRQIDRFAPYLTYGRARSKSDEARILGVTAASVATVPIDAGTTALVNGLKVGLEAFAGAFSNEYETITLGVRYDISDSMVLKTEIEQLRPLDETNRGGFRDIANSYNGKAVYLYSLSFDMLF